MRFPPSLDFSFDWLAFVVHYVLKKSEWIKDEKIGGVEDKIHTPEVEDKIHASYPHPKMKEAKLLRKERKNCKSNKVSKLDKER